MLLPAALHYVLSGWGDHSLQLGIWIAGSQFPFTSTLQAIFLEFGAINWVYLKESPAPQTVIDTTNLGAIGFLILHFSMTFP